MDPSAPCVSVVVPVFNERSTIALALQHILEEDTRKEVIIVDDGSHDGTERIVEEWVRSNSQLNESTVRIVLLRHPINRGKGSAIRTALGVAQGRFVIVQDADLELCPSCYGALLSPLLDGTAQFVMGCRRRQRTSIFSRHALCIASLGAMVRVLYGYRVRDAACCFKVLSLENLRKMKLEAERFEFCPEVIAKASRLGLTLQQVAVDYFPRSADEGKKLRMLKDGMMAIRTLLRNRKWKPPCENGCCIAETAEIGSAFASSNAPIREGTCR